MNRTDCIFCKIAKKELSAKIVYEDENFMAFHDVKAVSPIHILVIPKEHYTSLLEVNNIEILGNLLKRVQVIVQQEKINDGFRTVINTGDNGGQTVPHLHVHVLSGRFHKWPPG